MIIEPVSQLIDKKRGLGQDFGTEKCLKEFSIMCSDNADSINLKVDQSCNLTRDHKVIVIEE